MKKKALYITLAFLLVLCLFPTVSFANDIAIIGGGTFDISTFIDDGDGLIDTLRIITPQPVTLTNTGAVTATNFRIICVWEGVNLTLSGVTIDDSGNSGVCPLSFTGSGNTLALAAGTTNTLTGGADVPAVCVEGSATLTISGTGTLNAAGGSSAAGIGSHPGVSDTPVNGGTIRIAGGTIKATAGANAAAIGTGRYGNGGTIEISGNANITTTAATGESGTGIGWGAGSTHGGSIMISGGTINATGQAFGAGIGGDADDGTITISGGDVTAAGATASAAIGGSQGFGAGTIEIMGGIVNATSARGAAIGSGAFGAVEGSVEISGGTVIANSLYLGTGIGSGMSSTAAVNVTISDNADVTAAGDSGHFGGAGIGSGAAANSCNVTILGGNVKATGSQGAAGIGGGLGSSGGTITISGGSVTAASGGIYTEDLVDYTAAGIGGGSYTSLYGGGAGGTIAISGGHVYATGTSNTQDIGYGSGYTGTSGSLSISGTAAVFLRNNSSMTVTTITHKKEVFEEDTSKAYGLDIPAVWTPDFGAWLRLYKLEYSTNGGSGTAPASTDQHIGTTATVDSAGSYARAGYTQGTGWNTKADGSGSAVSSGNTHTFIADTTLFAKWEANNYTVKYNANGGTGTMADTAFTYDTAQALRLNSFTRTGYTFSGWAQSTGGAIAYTDGQSVKNLTSSNGGSVSLYALWTAHPVLTPSVSGTVFTGGRIMLTPNIPGGTWSYDASMFTLNGSTFTALKSGSSVITYTVDGVSVSYSVTVNDAELPNTGQDFTWTFFLFGLGIVMITGTALLKKRTV